jgi:myo-inositol-1(or 4)-monophosphatase
VGRRRGLAPRHRSRRAVGNFTGEPDFLHQREVVAGSPKIYGQLVQMLAPHTNVARGAADETAA